MKAFTRLSILIASCACALAVGSLAAGTNAAPAPSPVPADATSSQYIIGPGDSLQVFVWRNPELSATVPVRPDGKISTPLVEDMVAVGKTPSALARDIEKASFFDRGELMRRAGSLTGDPGRS